MTPISLSDHRRLDPILIKILGRVDAVAKSRGVAYLLTGAMARELLLVHVHGLPPGRATRDVDFGVHVQTWETFNTFKGALVDSGDFVGDESIPHRVYTVLERLGLRMPVDFVPFGPIEAPAGAIHWPPKGETVIDVRGFLPVQIARILKGSPPGGGCALPSERLPAPFTADGEAHAHI